MIFGLVDGVRKYALSSKQINTYKQNKKQK